MLEKFLRMSALLDFYGALLTEKQRRCLELHFLEDLSLSEIADRFEVSRQAVYDLIHRSSQVLEEYEAKLKLVERHAAERGVLERILQSTEEFAAAHHLQDCPELKRILRELASLIGKTGEA